jgi:hypothetical protein
MKRFLAIWLLALVAAAQNPAPTAAPADENAQKARRLIDQAIAALGGSAYLNIVDMKQQGRSYSFHHGQPTSVGLVYWRFWKFPDKERVELTKDRDVIVVHNGDLGFEITYKGVAEEERDALTDYLRRRRYSLDWVLRKWIHEPGVAFFYDGSAVAEQKPADQISIVSAKNESVTLFLDSTTHLPIKKAFSWRDPRDKERNHEEESYDSYRPVQGVMTPFSVTRYYNGDMANQRFLNSVAYNQNLPDSLFAATVGSKTPPKH